MRFLIPLATLLTAAAASCNVFRLRVAHSANQGLLSGQYLTNQTLDSNATISAHFNTKITAKFAAGAGTELLITGYDRMCVMPNGRVALECAGAQGVRSGWKLEQHELGKILVHGDAKDEGWVSAPRLLEGGYEDAEPTWEVYWGREGVSGPEVEGHSFKVVQECI